MDIKSPTGPSPERGTPQTPVEVSVATPRAVTRTWQVGQILNVIVIKVDQNSIILNLQGQSGAILLKAEGQIPVLIGQELRLQVMGTENPPLLKVLPSSNSQYQALMSAMRVTLPKQGPLPPLLANLAYMAKQPTGSTNPVVSSNNPTTPANPAAPANPATSTTPAASTNTKTPANTATPSTPTPPATTTTGQPQQPLPLPKILVELSRSLYEHLPDIDKASQPQTLKYAIQNTGLFLENTLARMANGEQTNPLHQDVRTHLLRLAAILRTQISQNQTNIHRQLPLPNSTPAPATATATPSAYPSLASQTRSPLSPNQSETAFAQPKSAAEQAGSAVRTHIPQAQATHPPSLATLLTQGNAIEELLRQVEGALARIQVQQLHTLASEEQGRPSWVIELPIRTEKNIDLFDLRIQRDPDKDGEKDGATPWSVTLAFDLEGLGPVRATVSLHGQHISATFWAEQQTTWSLFAQNLDLLRSRLNNVGLEVGKLNCKRGEPDDAPVVAELRLLDERA